MMHITRSLLKSTAAMAMALALGLLCAPAMAWDWSFGTRVLGSGQLSKTQRQVTGFKGVSLALPFGIEIVQGETEGVLIETDDNIAPLIETVVESDQLKIRWSERVRSIKPTALKITVNARTVERISISGSGSVRSEKIQSPDLQARISGSGDIRIATLNANALSVDIAGSGDFFASGRADTVRVRIAGSGNLKTGTLTARNVKLSIAGSGDANVWASQTLDVNIAGSGDVTYFGEAGVIQSVAGSGRIRKLGAAPNPGS